MKIPLWLTSVQLYDSSKTIAHVLVNWHVASQEEAAGKMILMIKLEYPDCEIRHFDIKQIPYEYCAKALGINLDDVV